MGGVLIGFGIIAVVIAVGYLIGRLDLLGPNAQHVISRLVFFVLSPSLLFTVLADADVHQLFSSLLAVSAISAVSSILVTGLIIRVAWRRPLPEAAIAGFSAGYTNANNIGIPVAVYVLGNAAYSAPVILLQLLVLAPIVLTILDLSTSGKVSIGRILLQPVRNPTIIASAIGVAFSVTGTKLPDPVMEPFRLMGGASVPLVLIVFGMSLVGRRVLEAGSERREIVLASAVKLAFMPLVAFLVGRFVFQLSPEHLFAVTVLGGLPAAQNMFVYAQRYGRGAVIARDVVLITTVGSVPILVGVAAVLS